MTEDGTTDASPLSRYGGYAELGFFVSGDRAGGIEVIGKYEYFRAETGGNPGKLNPVLLQVGTAGANYYIRLSVRLQLNGTLGHLKRARTEEQPDPPIKTYLDDHPSWGVVTQLQMWFQ